MTRIFPNRLEPLKCAFARQQLSALSAHCDVEVLAVIPHLFGSSLFGERIRSGRLRHLPARDRIGGLEVSHPRAPYVPRAGAALAPVNAALYFAGLLPLVPRLRGRFDVVLGAYLFPDACAAAWLANLLGVPYVVKAHGTDANVVADWPMARPLVRRALRGAAATVGVSRPMVDKLVRLGADPQRASLVRNGVDRSLFAPGDRIEARRALGLPEDGKLLVYVGWYVKEKGLRELTLAFERANLGPDVRLALVGEGPFRGELERAAGRPENGGRILVAGARPLAEVATFLRASDGLVLPSHAEGTPNVVLEALASGRPVVATSVGGIPDVVTHERDGLLVPSRDPEALAGALRRVLGRGWDPGCLSLSGPPSWEESAAELAKILCRAAGLEAEGPDEAAESAESAESWAEQRAA